MNYTRFDKNTSSVVSKLVLSQYIVIKNNIYNVIDLQIEITIQCALSDYI